VAMPARVLAARALSNEGDDPGLTDRVGPPVSEREATTESDKQSRPGSQTGWAHLSARGRQRADWVGRGGRRWAAAGPENNGGGRAEPFLGLKSNRVKKINSN
jgi:hypothetical protein